MPKYVVVDAPSNLGLRPTGVETLPIALKSAGLLAKLPAGYGGRVAPLPYSAGRDPATRLLNGPAIATYAQHLADVLNPLVQGGQFPVVLGGDCSVLLGCLLALRRADRYGLFFLDGHADFYQPEAELHGEVASMELALATGRGPDVLADLEGLRPLVQDADVVAYGFRDEEQARRSGSQDLGATAVHAYPLARVRQAGHAPAAAIAHLQRNELAGFWIHLDADVLADALMPAVDYRLPGDGLGFDELEALLRQLLATGRAVGLSLTIFNPLLDADGRLARRLVRCVAAGLRQPARPTPEP